MRYWVRLSFIILVLFGAVVTYAEQTLPDLGLEESYQGVFVQERHLSILQSPLISKGNFSINKSEGVVWSIVEPFSTGYIYSGDVLRQCSDPKIKITCSEIEKKDDPMLHGFFSFFFKVSGGDKKSLTEWFSLKKSDEEGVWLLSPKKDFLKKSFNQILIQVDAGKISSIIIEESNVDQKRKADKQVLSFVYQ